MDGCVVELGYGRRRDGFTPVAVMFDSIKIPVFRANLPVYIGKYQLAAFTAALVRVVCQGRKGNKMQITPLSQVPNTSNWVTKNYLKRLIFCVSKP